MPTIADRIHLRFHPIALLQLAVLCLLLLGLTWPSYATTRSQAPVDQELRSWLVEAVNQADSFEDRFDAEVWLVDMSARISRYVKDDQERLHILRSAHREAKRAGLPIDLVMGVIHTESLFQRFAISVVGAQGLMQVMPFWKNEIGRPEDNLTDIDTNLRYGCTILSYYLERSKGNLSEALARYNGSYGKMKYPNKVYAAQNRYLD
ncbi:lytic transglycosylase domain-containing protein [Motiliproteus coralliicola]|uniref:Lytic transglycosylase domain-containing protein n=1 Tax=Motiliproteus coralliicola TaxID=2283196 RepID=A0A369WQB9_9GAMM|nr:lytic transglycosylase domain-containing protein [Motiliproteus coralliicola]RDE22756.1 lytic transglycosylase domain-containing protein [Motiliproteus coralliicola]